jgi:hypothetical protein
MDQNMLERLLARMEAKIDSSQKKMDDMKASQEEIEATIRRDQEELIKVITGASPETTEACPEVTPACLEKEEEQAPEKTEAVEEPQENLDGVMEEEREPTPKETEVVADRQEVHKAATEDRAGDLRLVVRHHRQRKKRAQVDGEPRQKFAAFRGRFTRRAVPAMRKWHVRRGPGKRCCRRGIGRRSKASRAGQRGMARNNVEQGAPEGWTDDEGRRTRPDCNSGIRS